MNRVRSRESFRYTSDDKLMKVLCTAFESPIDDTVITSDEVSASFNNFSIGCIYFDRREDLEMLADALDDFITEHNMKDV